jgi:hypothetical protein
MGNFSLQKGPCNFLKLRTSPWGNPFLLLLSLFFFYLAFSFIHWRHLPLVPVLIPSPSLSPLRRPKQAAPGSGGSRRAAPSCGLAARLQQAVGVGASSAGGAAGDWRRGRLGTQAGRARTGGAGGAASGAARLGSGGRVQAHGRSCGRRPRLERSTAHAQGGGSGLEWGGCGASGRWAGVCAEGPGAECRRRTGTASSRRHRRAAVARASVRRWSGGRAGRRTSGSRRGVRAQEALAQAAAASKRAEAGGVSGTRAVRAGAVRQERWPSWMTTYRRACADAGTRWPYRGRSQGVRRNASRRKSEAEPAKWERVKDVRGLDMCRCDAARPKRARVQQQEEEEQLRGVQDDGVQGGHARCERSYSTAAAGGSVWEQRGRA